ncbi:MAG: YeeE/YedE family protein [Myxococcales bacterium]|nr:YeeE/YedE family protein [Myxococcales bacterium]
MYLITALIAGLAFGGGLALSGMTEPAKVLGFLDFTGHWDPSLAFVMGGALMIFGPCYFVVRRLRNRPLLPGAFDLPTKTRITPRLAVGATIFGAGWGLAGFCPGTAITSIPTLSASVLQLVAGIFIGILGTWGAEAALAHKDVQVQADF